MRSFKLMVIFGLGLCCSLRGTNPDRFTSEEFGEREYEQEDSMNNYGESELAGDAHYRPDDEDECEHKGCECNCDCGSQAHISPAHYPYVHGSFEQVHFEVTPSVIAFAPPTVTAPEIIPVPVPPTLVVLPPPTFITGSSSIPVAVAVTTTFIVPVQTTDNIPAPSTNIDSGPPSYYGQHGQNELDGDLDFTYSSTADRNHAPGDVIDSRPFSRPKCINRDCECECNCGQLHKSSPIMNVINPTKVMDQLVVTTETVPGPPY